MDRPWLDFDAMWAEAEAPPFSVRAFGETFLLPASKPAGLTLTMHRVRAERGPDAPLTWGEMEAAARFLVGAERWGRWLEEHRCTEEHVQTFVLNVLGEYWRRDREEADPPGEARGASEAPPT